MKQNLFKLFFIAILTLVNCIAIIAADSGTNNNKTYSLTNQFTNCDVDTFVTKKAIPKKEEKQESAKDDANAQLTKDADLSLLASAIGLGSIFFFAILSLIFPLFLLLSFLLGVAGIITSFVSNRKIKEAIKNKEIISESIKNKFLLSKILNIISISILSLAIIALVLLILFFILLLASI